MNLYRFQYTRLRLSDNTMSKEHVYCSSPAVIMQLVHQWNLAAKTDNPKWKYFLMDDDLAMANNPSPISSSRPASQFLDRCDPNRRNAYTDNLQHFFVILEDVELEQKTIERQRALVG